MIIIVQLGFELAYNDSGVQRFNTLRHEDTPLLQKATNNGETLNIIVEYRILT